MATYTTAQLSTKVLQKLGVLAAGEVAAAEDDTIVTGAIVNCLSELQNDGGLAAYASSAIPDYMFEGLAFYVVPSVAMEFGRPVDPGMRDLGLQMMRTAVSNRRIKDQAQSEYY